MEFEEADMNSEYGGYSADFPDGRIDDYTGDAITCDYDEVEDIPEETSDLASEPRPEDMSIADIKERLSEELERRREELVAKGLNEGLSDPFERQDASNQLLYRMQRAIEVGDMETVDNCVLTFSSLRTPDGVAIADRLRYGSIIYARGAAAGSTLANDELHKGLARERDLEAARDSTELYVGWTPFLDTTTEVFARHGLPAEHLIEEYAPTPVLKLSHLVQYAGYCRREGASPERMRQLEVAIVDSYMLLPNSSARDVCGSTLLGSLRYSDLRIAAFKRYRAASRSMMAETGQRMTWGKFADVLDGMLITPPSEMAPQEKSWLRNFANASDRATAEGFVAFRIDAAIAKGATPGEAVGLANELSAKDVRSVSDKQHELAHEVDRVLGKYAYRYATVGDFEATQTFLEAMTGSFRVVQIIAECMSYAATERQVQHLQGGPLQRLVHFELNIHWSIFDAIRRNDADGLESGLRALVSPPETPYANPSDAAGFRLPSRVHDSNILEQAFRHFSPERALVLGRELLDRALAHGEYSLIDTLSDILVGLGDGNEIRRRYAEACGEENQVLRATWHMNLASLLFRR